MAVRTKPRYVTYNTVGYDVSRHSDLPLPAPGHVEEDYVCWDGVGSKLVMRMPQVEVDGVVHPRLVYCFLHECWEEEVFKESWLRYRQMDRVQLLSQLDRLEQVEAELWRFLVEEVDDADMRARLIMGMVDLFKHAKVKDCIPVVKRGKGER